MTVDPGTAALIAAGATSIATLIGAVTQFRKLRDENRTQHADGQIANEQRWERVMESLGNVHGTVQVTRQEQTDGFKAVLEEQADQNHRLDNLEDVVGISE